MSYASLARGLDRRELSRLEWRKAICPKCGEEMNQYLMPQEEVEEALAGAGWLETICSYCQNGFGWMSGRLSRGCDQNRYSGPENSNGNDL